MALDILANFQALFYFAAFLVGGWFFGLKKAPLYFRLLFCGVVCFLLEELYYLTDYACTGAWSEEYSFAAFGAGAGYSFMLSANYGMFDSIVDDGSADCRRIGRLALLTPMVLAAVYALASAYFIKTTGNVGYVILTVLCKAPMVLAAYYHTKHLLLPDRLHFLVEPLRLCNGVCLVLILADMLSDVFYAVGRLRAYSMCETVFSVALVGMMVTAERGRRGWIT